MHCFASLISCSSGAAPYDLGWEPAGFDQAFKRSWRQLQQREVNIDRYFVPNDPLEDFIKDVNLRKEKVLEQLGLHSTGSLTSFGLS